MSVYKISLLRSFSRSRGDMIGAPGSYVSRDSDHVRFWSSLSF